MTLYYHPTGLPKEVAVQAAKLDLIGVDIETAPLDWSDREYWRHPKGVALITLAVGDDVHVVRPSGDNKWLIGLMGYPDVVKVFHHAMFDLTFMRHHLGVQAQNVSCTKVASKLLYPDRTKHSLSGLLQEHLGVEIDKGLSCSDWFAELSPEQLAYCANDVQHLVALDAALTNQLLATNDLFSFADEAWRFLPVAVELRVTGYNDLFSY